MTETLVLAPTAINFRLPPHADVNLQFQLTNAAGAPLDITTDTIKLVAFRSLRQPALLIEKTNATDEHSDPINGKTQFALTPADTNWVVDEDTVHYEVWRTYAGGKEIPWFKGIILFQSLRGTEA